MNHDIDVKKLRVNCFRQSKVAGEFMIQLRVPGSLIKAKYLAVIQHIAETWGDGTFHIGTRQTLNAPGIKYKYVDEVNAYIQDYIKEIEIEACGIEMESNEAGYPTIGARNIVACIGNSHCIKANVNTHELARKMEKEIFPSHYHMKMNIAGCPNDCSKAHFCDFGIIGLTIPEYMSERCIGCGRCATVCKKVATGVLELVNNKIEKDMCCCTGCGECVSACPSGAWAYSKQKFYRVMIGGRTGKQTPRMGKMFLNWVTEDVLIAVIKNWQNFSATILDHKPLYLHGGHLIDKAGYHRFRELMLKDVKLNPEAMVAERIFWTETEYRSNINVKKPGSQGH